MHRAADGAACARGIFQLEECLPGRLATVVVQLAKAELRLRAARGADIDIGNGEAVAPPTAHRRYVFADDAAVARPQQDEALADGKCFYLRTTRFGSRIIVLTRFR